MWSDMDRPADERAGSEPAACLDSLMACYDWTAWQAPECPEADTAPAGETDLEAIMRCYQTR